MAFTAKTNWAKGEELPHTDMNRIEQGIKDAHTDISKKQDSSSALKLGTTASTAKAGNYKPAINDIQGASAHGRGALAANNLQNYYRGLPPIYFSTNENVDFDSLDHGEYLIVSYGDGSTNAPPKAEYYYLEVIFTHDTNQNNVLQRAWGYKTHGLYTRVRVNNKWSEWLHIGAELPLVANEGDVLKFKGGDWVAEAP